MTSLFVFFIHGGKSTLKMAMRPVLNKPSVLVIGVNFEKGGIDILGCPFVTSLMQRKEDWFRPDPHDKMALYKQLYDQVKKSHKVLRAKTCFYAEGNFTVLKGKILEKVVVDMLNYTEPGYAMLPAGTLECCRLINYWIRYYHLPAYELKKEFDSHENYYATVELTEQKISELNQVVKERRLTCAPPFIATFEKTCSPSVIGDVLSTLEKTILSIANTPLEFLDDQTQLNIFDVNNDANRVYLFEEGVIDFREDASFTFAPTLFANTCSYTNTQPITPIDFADDKKSNSRSQLGIELLSIQEESPKGVFSNLPEDENFEQKKLINRQSSSSFVVEQEGTKREFTKKTPFSFWSLFSCRCKKSVSIIPHSSAKNDDNPANSLPNTLA